MSAKECVCDRVTPTIFRAIRAPRRGDCVYSPSRCICDVEWNGRETARAEEKKEEEDVAKRLESSDWVSRTKS